MRRLSKPWPPQNVSPNGQAERSFGDAKREYLAAMPSATNRTETARTTFDRMDKAKLRAVMYGEQGRLCAYCERPLDENAPFPRIDHWRPLAHHPELALHWENLYLSCPSSETCDVCKGNNYDRLNPAAIDPPWLTDCDYMQHVGFGRRGDIYVRKDTSLDPNERDALRLAVENEPDDRKRPRSYLNLNHPALIAARKAAIDSERSRMARDFQDQAATAKDRAQRTTALLNADPYPPFVSIRTAWLRKQLGKGK